VSYGVAMVVGLNPMAHILGLGLQFGLGILQLRLNSPKTIS